MEIKLLVVLFLFSYSYGLGQNKLNLLVTGDASENSPHYIFIKHLEEKLGQRINIIIEPLSKNIKDKISSNEVNLALLTPYNYAYIQSQFREKIIEPLAAPGTADGKMAFYHACIFARKDAQVKSLQDLQKYASKLRFSFAKASSTSGHVFPRLQLAAEGIAISEDIFKEVDFSGGHDKTILAVIKGEADIGGVAFEHLRDYLQQNPTYKDSIQILWQSYPLPHATLVGRSDLSSAIKQKIKNILLNIHQEISKKDFEIVRRMWGMDEITCFVEPDENVYQPVIETTKKNRRYGQFFELL